MTRSEETPTIAFDAPSFVARLASVPDGSVRVTGVTPRVLKNNLENIRNASESRGIQVVVADLSERSGHVMSATIRRYLEHVDAMVGVPSSTMRLAEALQASGSESREAQTDTLARLWTDLASQLPALLIVVHAASGAQSDLDVLEHFAQFVYSDPLAELTPEAQAWDRPNGKLVLVGDVPFDHDTRTVDYADTSVAAIRDYLGRDDVVRRFLATTDGDLRKLGDLVDRLPDNAQHFALYQFDALETQERAVLEILAVAAQPVSPDHLHDAVALLGASEFFAKSLRALEQRSFLTKAMGDGQIVISLEDAGFGAALRERLTDERLQLLHRAFADAERARHGDDPDVELLARHYALARDAEVAREYGMRAIARMQRRRELAGARELAELLLADADGRQAETLNLQLVDILEQLGEFREALDACARCGGDNAALTLRRASLLTRLGRWDAALETLDRLEDADDEVDREAMLVRADAAYAIGRHDEAVGELQALLEQLGQDGLEPSVRDRALLSARNTMGKIAIVQSRFSDAVDAFEANRELANQWGWDEEVSRAQANLGVVALQRDDHGEALDRLQQALEVSGSRGSLPRAYCLMNLASVYQRKNEFERALDHCLEAMRCARKAGDQNAYTVSARNLATIYQDLGAYDRATSIVEHLHTEHEGDEGTLAGGWNLLVQAQLLHDCGDLTGAQVIYERMLDARLAAVFGPEANLRLAEIHAALGHDERAREYLEAADLGERSLYHGLASLLRAEAVLDDEPKIALELARTAHEILQEVGEKNEPVRARIAMAKALVAMDRAAEAVTELERELAAIREHATHVPEAFVHSFWSKPLHRELVRELRALDANVPDECVPVDPVVASPQDEDVDEAQFRAWRQRYANIVGEDAKLHKVFRLIDKVAPSEATVLVYGESGTGKEMVASALHERSDRRGRPFVKVNCAAFVENLLLSELFGHEKGAFTGAHEQKVGRFELADGGTIFLDEIGDISPNTQVALLRVLQEGTFERVGGSQTQQTNVRVVCATNKNLEEMVRRGDFRLDLYYRLKGVVIEMPALRERREDIGRLANHFALAYSPGAPKGFGADALQFLASYSWPGNVRELQNFVRSILLFVDGNEIRYDDIEEFREFFVSGDVDPNLPPIDFSSIVGESGGDQGEEATPGDDALYAFADPADALVEKIVAEGRSLSDIKKKLEMECIKRALIETGGNVTQAAEILQMKRPRLSQIINGDEELTALKARLTA